MDSAAFENLGRHQVPCPSIAPAAARPAADRPKTRQKNRNRARQCPKARPCAKSDDSSFLAVPSSANGSARTRLPKPRLLKPRRRRVPPRRSTDDGPAAHPVRPADAFRATKPRAPHQPMTRCRDGPQGQRSVWPGLPPIGAAASAGRKHVITTIALAPDTAVRSSGASREAAAERYSSSAPPSGPVSGRPPGSAPAGPSAGPGFPPSVSRAKRVLSGLQVLAGAVGPRSDARCRATRPEPA